jgi:hypothetical protein
MPKKNAKPDTAEYWDDVKRAKGSSGKRSYTPPPADDEAPSSDYEAPSGSYGSSDSNEYVETSCGGSYDDGTWVWDD